MSLDPVRARALETLVRVAAGRPLDGTLAGHFTRLREQRDRNLLGELVRGAVQWQARYDVVIAHFARKRPPQDERLTALLRLALHQLLGMDGIPPYAAIHQAGELCRAKVSARQVGFVNGLLQSARRELLGAWDPTADGAGADPRPERMARLFRGLEPGSARWIAAWHSHPQWLVERWIERWGAARAEAICAVNNRPVQAVLQVLPPAGAEQVAAELAAEELATAPGPIPGSLIPERRLARREWDELLRRRPELIVQDPVVREATEWLAGPLLCEAPAVAAPRLLDVCAAPGGKSALLAALLPGSWSLVAADLNPARVRLLADTLRRTARRPVAVVTADGTRAPFRNAAFDAVLLDGPCSGTGVLRHHAEGRWRLTPATLAANGERLLELARQAADLLAPGGRLLYATCSLEPEENERVLERLLADRPDLFPDADDAEDRNAWQRAWTPDATGGDGFFAARLRRTPGRTDPRGGCS